MLGLLCVAVALAAAAAGAQLQEDPHSFTALERSSSSSNVCGTNASVAAALFQAVNLSWPGLQQVRAQVKAGQMAAACEALADYYMNSSSGSWLRVPYVKPGTARAGGEADAALQDIFRLTGVDETAKIPRNPDGSLQWWYEGPRHDPEFMNCLNRHAYFMTLVDAWRATGNPVYAAKVGDLVYDWVIHNPGSLCHGTEETPWRILEVGIRTAGPWPATFYALQQPTTAFNTSARALMLLGVYEHGVNLVKYQTGGAPNWLMQQYAGLINIALSFPELNGAEDWLQVGIKGLLGELNDNVYPDGVETEQTSGYDQMSTENFFRVLNTLELANRTAPGAFRERVESMFNYLAMSIDQRGLLPRNGDADVHVAWSGASSHFEYFNRSDWLYVATNGKNGTRPPGPPSTIFPWAGQFIMRSGYEREDQWAFFDIGVYGSSGHAHRDKLHLNIRAYESFLLADSGRFAYNGDNAVWHRDYAPTTRAHNTLSIDDKNQAAAPPVAKVPVANSSFKIDDLYDLAVAEMADWDALEGQASHTRSVFYSRGQWWVVVDTVRSDRPGRVVEVCWHAHPNGTATLLDHGASTIRGFPKGYLSIVPTSPNGGQQPWNSSVVKGLKPPQDPYFQGWYSASYLDCEPADTLVQRTHLTTNSSTFAWLLIPSATPPLTHPGTIEFAEITDQHVTVRISIPGAPTAQVTIPTVAPASRDDAH